MSFTENHKRFHEFVEALSDQHPDLKLTFGYVGSLYAEADERSWKLFTQLREDRGIGQSVTFYLGSTSSMESRLENYEALSGQVQKWIDSLDERIKSGLIS